MVLIFVVKVRVRVRVSWLRLGRARFYTVF